MSNTPRTDALTCHAYQFIDETTKVVKQYYVRQLERELNAANKRIKRLEEAGNAMYTLLDSPSACMRTSTEDNALQGWDDAKIKT